MKKRTKRIMALLLSAVLAVSNSAGVWASEADAFTDGVLFDAEEEAVEDAEAEIPFADMVSTPSDINKTGGIPGIRQYALPDGKEGEEYSFQLETDTDRDVVWVLNEGSELPEGMTFSEDGYLFGVPAEAGAFRLFVAVRAGELEGEKFFELRIAEKEKVPAEYEFAPMRGTTIDLGVIPVGEVSGGKRQFVNSGTEPLHFNELPAGKYFDFGWEFFIPGEEVKPGDDLWFNARVKENLPAGKYEEKAIISTTEGPQCEVTVKAVVGAESEEDYMLKFSPEKVEFPFSYFTFANKEEKSFTVENVGQKDTAISMDISGLKNFTLRENSFPNGEKVFKPGEEYTFYVKPSVDEGKYEEAIIFTTDDGSKFPMVLKMNSSFSVLTIKQDPYSIEFENLTEGYKKVPSRTVTIENTYSEDITVGISHSEGIEVGVLSKKKLKPGEKAQLEVKPVTGLKEERYHAYIFFTLRAADGKVSRDEMDVGFRVMPYIRLAAPYMDNVVSAQNNCTVKLREEVEDADGYQVVAVADTADIASSKYIASVETTSLTAKLKYLPRGRYYVTCRSYADTEKGREYGNWLSGFKAIKITDVTPETPKISAASVRYCDLKLQVSIPQKVDGCDVVLARKRQGTEPSDYAVVEKGVLGSSKEITLYDVPKGTYYAAVHTYKYNKAGKKVFSRWSNFKKVIIQRAKTDEPPVLKKVTVSGRDVILTVSRSRGTHGSYWVLAKKYYKDETDRKHYIPTNYSYIIRSRTETKVVFKNVKPGRYYVSGHGYLSAYKRYYTKWSSLKKITVR